MQFLRDRALWLGVAGGIIAGLILLIFIQPLIGFIWPVFVAILANTFQGLLDRIYENAAFGHRDAASVFLVIALVSGWLGASVMGTFILEKTTRMLVAGKQDKKDEPSDLQAKIKKTRFLRVLAWWSLVPLVILSPFVVTLFLADLQLNTSFQQRMAVLAPHITDQEGKELRAAWALMRSRNDYLMLNERLEKRASDLGVSLPPPLLR